MEILSARVLLRPRDPAATLAFYRDQLDLAIAREYPGGVVFFAGSTLIEVAAHLAADTAVEPTTALWLQVRDADATEADLRAAAVPITRSARTEPWGLRELHATDPDGRTLIFVEIPADHPLRVDQRPAP
ncbi:VOC family protein [Williamsia sp. CHRR-6]|uniref:VOC family protein n=1 Tax=Williamsia sp. CHRR-6 TaxID=2835871 RepID=UPI001BD930FA|nr:VOC family protein [Williamsia sp. CHRR-6]MBT0565938.1 VOC family protein [Williamsia sp. CHRR-6]